MDHRVRPLGLPGSWRLKHVDGAAVGVAIAGPVDMGSSINDPVAVNDYVSVGPCAIKTTFKAVKCLELHCLGRDIDTLEGRTLDADGGCSVAPFRLFSKHGRKRWDT